MHDGGGLLRRGLQRRHLRRDELLSGRIRVHLRERLLLGDLQPIDRPMRRADVLR